MTNNDQRQTIQKYNENNTRSAASTNRKISNRDKSLKSEKNGRWSSERIVGE